MPLATRPLTRQPSVRYIGFCDTSLQPVALRDERGSPSGTRSPGRGQQRWDTTLPSGTADRTPAEVLGAAHVTVALGRTPGTASAATE